MRPWWGPLDGDPSSKCAALCSMAGVRGLSFHLLILVAVVQPRSHHANNPAAIVFAELELQLDIDAIKLCLRQRAHLTFTERAGSNQIAILMGDFCQLIFEAVLAHVARQYLGG